MHIEKIIAIERLKKQNITFPFISAPLEKNQTQKKQENVQKNVKQQETCFIADRKEAVVDGVKMLRMILELKSVMESQTSLVSQTLFYSTLFS